MVISIFLSKGSVFFWVLIFPVYRCLKEFFRSNKPTTLSTKEVDSTSEIKHWKNGIISNERVFFEKLSASFFVSKTMRFFPVLKFSSSKKAQENEFPELIYVVCWLNPKSIRNVFLKYRNSYRYFLRVTSRSSTLFIPTSCSTGFPSLKTIIVGMLIMRNFWGVCGFSSTFIFIIFASAPF